MKPMIRPMICLALLLLAIQTVAEASTDAELKCRCPRRSPIRHMTVKRPMQHKPVLAAPAKPVQSVARIVMESSPEHPVLPVAKTRRDDPQWMVLTSEQRWQQYSYP